MAAANRLFLSCATGFAMCSTVAEFTMSPRQSFCDPNEKAIVRPLNKKKKKKCIIIGGGVAGVASAHELGRLGVEVRVLEKSNSISAECSAAPCGVIHRQSSCVGSSELESAIKCFFSFGNEFKFAKIDWWKTLSDPHFLRWALLFCHNSLWLSNDIHEIRRQNKLHYYDFAIDLLENLMFEQYNGEIGGDIGCRRGALKPLRGETALLKAQVSQHCAQRHHSQQCEASICQREFGVEFQCNTQVMGFDLFGGRITAIHTCSGSVPVPEDTDVLVAAGSWTPMVMRQLDLFAPVYPMKGYTLRVDMSSNSSCSSAGSDGSDNDNSNISAIEFPQRVVTLDSLYMSRFLDEVRITSMGEFSGYDTKPGEDVVDSVKKQAINLFPNQAEAIKAAPAMVGLRPLVFDNMLMAGKVPCLHNLYVNVGPSQTAWKGCMGSARIVAAAVTQRTDLLSDTFDEEMYSPEGKIVKSPFFCQLADKRFKYF